MQAARAIRQTPVETPQKWVPVPRMPYKGTPLTVPAPEPDLQPGKAVGKKPTRASRIATILKTQQDHPTTADAHVYQETAGYLKCTKCNQAVHKRANEEIFNNFLESTCIDGAFPIDLRVLKRKSQRSTPSLSTSSEMELSLAIRNQPAQKGHH